MKAHALTLSLLSVIGCSSSTTTTVVEEEVDIEETKSSSEPEKTPKKAQLPMTEEMQSPSPSPQSNDDGAKCTLKSSREDCQECCQVVGGGHCRAACDEKPAANDCRNNGCPGGGESCNYCWTRYVCLRAGTIC